jgi:hypothetical protein
MNEQLQACEEKLGRVEEQLVDLKGVILDYLRDSRRITPKVNVKKRQVTFSVARVTPPPLAVSVLAGEILHNLRCPLEYLVCAFLEKEGVTRHNTHGFPVCLTADTFVKKAKVKLKGLSPAVVAAIDGLQPYHRSDPDRHPLHILEEFNNIDKHRLLPTGYQVIHDGSFWVHEIPNTQYSVVKAGATVPLEPGTHVLTIGFAKGINPNEVKVQLRSACDVHFRKIPGLQIPTVLGVPNLYPVFNTLLKIRSHLHEEIFCKGGVADLVGWRPTRVFEVSQDERLRYATAWIPE